MPRVCTHRQFVRTIAPSMPSRPSRPRPLERRSVGRLAGGQYSPFCDQPRHDPQPCTFARGYHHRPVSIPSLVTHPPQRSFKPRRRGLSPSRIAAYERAMAKWGLAVDGPQLSLEDTFGGAGEVVLDVGFGGGEALIEMAELRPVEHVIGVDVHTPGIATVLDGNRATRAAQRAGGRRRCRRFRGSYSGANARRDSGLLPRSVAETSPAQPAPDPARRRRPVGALAPSRWCAACRHR